MKNHDPTESIENRIKKAQLVVLIVSKRQQFFERKDSITFFL